MIVAQMSISLPEELKRFAEQKAKSGEYSTPSDYVRSLIRRDKEQTWARLEKLLLEGLNSGDPIFDSEETIAALREEARRRLAEHKGGQSGST